MTGVPGSQLELRAKGALVASARDVRRRGSSIRPCADRPRPVQKKTPSRRPSPAQSYQSPVLPDPS
jgi:hypothetical protein